VALVHGPVPSAACSSGRVRSTTLPGSICRFQISSIGSGRKRRAGAGPPCRCTWDITTDEVPAEALDLLASQTAGSA
jgi:hypothetical protein